MNIPAMPQLLTLFSCWRLIIINIVFFMFFTGSLHADTTTVPLRQFGYGKLTCSALSSNGTKMVTGSADGKVRLWDVASGEVVRTFMGHRSGVELLAISGDGSRVASTDDLTLSTCDAVTGALLSSFTAPEKDLILSMVMSGDGSRVLIGTRSGRALFIDAATGGVITSFLPPGGKLDDWVQSVAISKDATMALSGQNNKIVRLWDVNTGALIRTFYGQRNGVDAVAFSGNDSMVVATARDTIMFWNTNNGNAIDTIIDNSWAKSITISSDNTKMLTQYFHGATLWEIRNKNKLHSFSFPDKYININNTPYAMSGDGSKLLLNVNSTTVKLFNGTTGVEISTFTGHTLDVTSIALSTDCKKVLTGSTDNAATLWDASTGKVIRSFTGHTASVNSVALSPDGSKVITASADSSVKIWNAATGAQIHSFSATTYSSGSVAFSSDGQKVFYISDSAVCIMDIATANVLTTFSVTGKSLKAFRIAITGDDSKILTTFSDSTARFWDVATGNVLGTYGTTGRNSSIAVSNDGKKVLIASFDHASVLLRDVATRNVLPINPWPSTQSVAFAPDGSMVLTGKNDGIATLFDASTGEKVRDFSRHVAGVTSLAFSTDGKRFVTGSGEGTAKLWDISGNAPIARPLTEKKQSDITINFFHNNHICITSNNPVNFQNARMVISTLCGRTIVSYNLQTLKAQKDTRFTLPANLSRGVYFYRFLNGNRKQSGMFSVLEK
jgi:WD40 repeat protein